MKLLNLILFCVFVESIVTFSAIGWNPSIYRMRNIPNHITRNIGDSETARNIGRESSDDYRESIRDAGYDALKTYLTDRNSDNGKDSGTSTDSTNSENTGSSSSGSANSEYGSGSNSNSNLPLGPGYCCQGYQAVYNYRCQSDMRYYYYCIPSTYY
uniref:Uncharacterized protein n=1 Tax=Panagrolaimus sp. JU765 TaxID=591449 RepID=A0AC34QT98_9BILA